MRILAIETASEACSVALFEGDQLVAYDHRVLGRGHAENLIPMISALPDKGRADRILVSVGPGSFTGVRVGVGAGRALGVAWKAEVYGYPTLQLVAAMALAKSEEGVTVCMNGGHGEWFVQDFGADGRATSDARSLPPEDAIKSATYSYVAGNKAQEFGHLCGREECTVFETLPDARFALHIPDITSGATRLPPTPIYGRAPDATPQKGKVTS